MPSPSDTLPMMCAAMAGRVKARARCEKLYEPVENTGTASLARTKSAVQTIGAQLGVVIRHILLSSQMKPPFQPIVTTTRIRRKNKSRFHQLMTEDLSGEVSSDCARTVKTPALL